MRTSLIIAALFIAPFVGHCAADQDTLKFYFVSDEPVSGGRYIDTATCPKVGYITNTPNLVVSHLQGISTNTVHTTIHYNSKVSVRTNTAISIQMTTADGKLLASLTRENIGHRILITLGERPLMAPMIQSAIESGDFQITLPDGEDTEATLAAFKKFVRH
jgi:preprotein translocase subunit SecD